MAVSQARMCIDQLRATMNMGCQAENHMSHSYEEVCQIGTGAYGTVYKARDLKNDGQFVAIKKIRIQTSAEEGMPMSTIREIAMLKQLENFEHRNIVRYKPRLPQIRRTKFALFSWSLDAQKCGSVTDRSTEFCSARTKSDVVGMFLSANLGDCS